jgi:GT2 family glycosyltransferase
VAHSPRLSLIAERVDYERREARWAWQQAEANPSEARQWLERAYRFTPSDRNLAFSLASARLAAGDPRAARALFERLASQHGTREVLGGLAACALSMGDGGAASTALGRALSTSVPDDTLAAIASALGAAWCGLTLDGLVLGTPAAGITLDGRAVGRSLPDGWRTARVLRVTHGGGDLLGSPVDIRAITRTEGFVERVRGGIAGWAWHPAAPDTDPLLHVIVDGAERSIVATDLSVTFAGTSPLARPRGFRMACPPARVVRVLDADGRDVLGSPLGGRARVRPAPRPTGESGVAVVVPVYRGLPQTLACLRSVLQTIGPADRLIVVDDASPVPALVEALHAMAAEGSITLIAADPAEPTRNRGFPTAANAGMLAASGRDVVLLNSDTIVYPGWLAALREAARSAPDIGTATPLSNDASIFTYPEPGEPAPMLNEEAGARLAALALTANAGVVVDVPVGHGFCLYIRADCLHAAGMLRPELFAQGYGEENDFCERARVRGWRHVAVPGVYVGHEGGVSFGTARNHLLARNAAILDRLYPDYHARVQAFIAADPLGPARAALDQARLTAGAGRDAVLLISHAGHGGTARVVAERAAVIRQAGLRPLVLRGSDGVSQFAEDGQATPNLRYTLPADLEALSRALRAARVVRAEVHHVLGHGHAIGEMLDGIGVSFDVWVHDYLWLCARLALVTGEGRFCGEPPTSVCIGCVARWGDAMEVPITPPELRARSAVLLGRAESVIAPSEDVARRVRRHFPQARLRLVAWEADPPERTARLAHGISPGAPMIVAVVGAIGMEKGYDVVLACARDAASRALPLRFTVIGFTPDDRPLLETGHAFVTGPFRAAEARETITAAGAHLALLPSIWPETWCFALSDIWAAGLDAAVFDIGTPAERVRRTQRGWILPLGLPPARVNDALLNLQGPASRS